MNNIKILPYSTINKISSGEIIYKPFLILKELLENSLDAKSSFLKIYFKNKGMKLIKVVDNGFGINKKNLLMCIKNNSTSKIFFFEDLYKLNSFGFRGQALSLISSICRFCISSNCINQNIGWSLFNDLNNFSKFYIKPISHNIGTIVSVKDIYINIPFNRNKLFLYLNYEWFLIKKFINNFILCNYNIKFNIFNNNKLFNSYFYNKNKKESIINRIINIYGNINKKYYIDIFGDYWFCYGFFLLFNKFKIVKLIFINNRIISKDNFLFKVFNDFIINFLNFKKLSYIFYFFIDYKYININICPNKSKILFLNNIDLYNSIYKNLLFFFKKKKIFNLYNSNINNLNLVKDVYKEYYSLEKINNKNYLQFFIINFGKIISIINNKYLFSIKDNFIIISNLCSIFYYFNFLVIKYNFYNLIWTKKVLIIFSIDKLFININEYIINLLNKLGFYFIIDINQLIVKFFKIPLFLNNINFKKFLLDLDIFLFNKDNFKIINIIYWIKNFIFLYKNININESIILISNFCNIVNNIDFKIKIFKFLDLNDFLW